MPVTGPGYHLQAVLKSASERQQLEALVVPFRYWPKSPTANGLFNTVPSQHAVAHPVHRQLSLQNAPIRDLSDAGIGAKEIQTVVRESGSLATRRDIYNRIAAIRREAWEGQSPVHALASHLEKQGEENQGWWSRFQTDSNGRVTAVFFTHLEINCIHSILPRSPFRLHLQDE